nr:hypothetical protein [Tanacetum cinerariifolium]
MINSIKNGDQPLPRVTQVSIAGTSSTEQPPLKDKSMWSDQEKRIQKIDQNQGDVNDAMGSKKKTVVVTSDPLALIAEKKTFNQRKFYSKPTNNNLRTSSTSQSANKKQEFVKNDNNKVKKKDDEKKRDMSRVKCYNYKKEGHFVKDCKKVKVKDYEYYKTKMLLAKKDKDEKVLLTKDQAWMESSSDSDQEINANMVFMAQNFLFQRLAHRLLMKRFLRYFEKAKDLRPTLYDENVIGLGYTSMFLTHSDEALEIEKFKRSRENKIEFAYDYGNLNASYVNEKNQFGG